jgi:hypothetical protein
MKVNENACQLQQQLNLGILQHDNELSAEMFINRPCSSSFSNNGEPASTLSQLVRKRPYNYVGGGLVSQAAISKSFTSIPMAPNLIV